MFDIGLNIISELETRGGLVILYEDPWTLICQRTLHVHARIRAEMYMDVSPHVH